MQISEWGGVPLIERSFEEVCAVLERGGDIVEVLVESAPPSDDHAAATAPTPHQLLYEPDTDKSPSSPTRRKLPKTPRGRRPAGGVRRSVPRLSARAAEPAGAAAYAVAAPLTPAPAAHRGVTHLPEQDRCSVRERPPARAQMQVWFESELRKLVVMLLAADDLPPRDHTLGYGDEPEAFARIRLLPSLESCPPVETDPASASCSPVWNATLGFGGLTADLLAGRALELTLWDACPGIDPVLIGECTMDLEKAFAEERAVWWTLEERGGTRSAGASPRSSLTGARALRRGDFASQRSVSASEISDEALPSTHTHSKHTHALFHQFTALSMMYSILTQERPATH
ncbi:Protein piccolo [Eumeta japonica]|uniref:Protein piccolo n=1 Tax=Eumeta variegata TaxID=151549 RepID=A0A4C1TNC2_EUMVA|nr:Protein piccolo [Eumeta japonica]